MNILLSSPTENTYLPQGLICIFVIYFKCILRLCSTMLSKGELNTFTTPSVVPAIMAGIFH